MRKAILLLMVAGALLLGAKAMAQTGTNNLTLAWIPSTSAGVAGYDIYYGTSSGNYMTAVPIFGATNVTLRGLASGQTYYIAATSFDTNGNQSGFSPEITATVGSVTQAARAVLSAAVGLPAGQFGFALTGTAGAQYVVQASTDLIHWVTLQTNIAPFRFVDSNTSQFTHRFYRTVSISN
ncbi:MAG TPA: fibronectin type III domain-containing protein [Verrucomicrobiae bacterium]|jgi:hypothetical protein